MLAKRIARLEEMVRARARVPTAVKRARAVCEQLLQEPNSIPVGLDVAGAMVALDGPGADAAGLAFLERGAELGCEPCISAALAYHLDRVGPEAARQILRDFGCEDEP
jgi:hypothetical protein